MMTDIAVTLISLAGTAVGSLGGILAANRLTNYRIEQLEKKVDKHNCLIERMYKAEGCIETLKQRFDDMEKSE
jgi:hypothetical protein